MQILIPINRSQSSCCPYLKEKQFTQEYFFAHGLSPEEYQSFLDHRWRRFGLFFFRPVCTDCRECIPIRIRTGDFQPSRSQKKNLRKNAETRMFVRPLAFRQEIFRVYTAHQSKFSPEKPITQEDFIKSYYQPAVPGFQTEYYVEDRLAGIGYLDVASRGLSSVYFAYDPQFQHRGLGTFSILKEIQLAKEKGFPYYYLGYYIEDCPRMSYKGRFLPQEKQDPHTGTWIEKSP